MDNDQFLTVKEVAQRLRLSTKTIHRWIAAGKLQGYWAGSDRAGWRIRASDVDTVLQPQRPVDQPRQRRLPLEEQRDQGKLAA